ncbi:MAG TPA: hypothetical protein VMH41_16810 [Mycobacteriales bacterium]|nr:hypothetical protein [Mycobacteriales bacterium]
MILNRPANAWLGALLAVYAVIAYIAGFAPALNDLIVAAIGAVVMLIANSPAIAAQVVSAHQAKQAKRQ